MAGDVWFGAGVILKVWDLIPYLYLIFVYFFFHSYGRRLDKCILLLPWLLVIEFLSWIFNSSCNDLSESCMKHDSAVGAQNSLQKVFFFKIWTHNLDTGLNVASSSLSTKYSRNVLLKNIFVNSKIYLMLLFVGSKTNHKGSHAIIYWFPNQPCSFLELGSLFFCSHRSSGPLISCAWRVLGLMTSSSRY